VPNDEAKELKALEACLLRKRRVGQDLFDLDAFERWGPSPATAEQLEQTQKDEARLLAERKACCDELTAEVERLRREAPSVVARWVELHDAYLRGIPSTDRTVQLVAEEERAAWAAVGRGEQPFVEENVYYVTIDPARYETVFGFAPDDPSRRNARS
jgi:hypothetical protein